MSLITTSILSNVAGLGFSSHPTKKNVPIKNENAHLDVSIGGIRIGGFYANSEKIEITLFDFVIEQAKDINIQFTFGNDYFNDKKNRDLIIYGASIEKLN